MIPLEIHVLVSLLGEQIGVKELAKAVDSSYRRTAEVVKSLVEKGFVRRSDNQVRLADTLHAVLFKRLTRRYDMVKLLGDSRENVAMALLNADDIKGLQGKTSLTYWTIKRALNGIMETGAVRESAGRYSLADDRDLSIFLQSWREEKERRSVEPYAEITYASRDVVLKRVPLGKPAKGSLTAFSTFAAYGVRIRPLYDYYVQPERNLSLEDVLVHAIVFSGNPVELTDCAILFAKNFSKIDLKKAREVALKLYVEDKLLVLENYVRGLTVSSPEMFLPWKEFEEKAHMYGVDAKSLLASEVSPDFMLLEGQLVKPVSFYIFGGESMRTRRLKRATKDIDIVLKNEPFFRSVERALLGIGYNPLGEDEFTVMDRKLEPSGIFVKEGYPRIDLFVKRICGAFILSESMKARAEFKAIGKLSLYIMSNEDIFLLKSITDREGDIYDMVALAKAPGFNWKTVIAELYHQEEMTGRHFCRHLLDSIEVIEKRFGIRAPFYDQLVNHCIDQAILESIERWGATSLRQIRELVNYPEYRLRSRITKMVEQGMLMSLRGGSPGTPRWRIKAKQKQRSAPSRRL